jgi:hypothetical protein
VREIKANTEKRFPNYTNFRSTEMLHDPHKSEEVKPEQRVNSNLSLPPSLTAGGGGSTSCCSSPSDDTNPASTLSSAPEETSSSSAESSKTKLAEVAERLTEAPDKEDENDEEYKRQQQLKESQDALIKKLEMARMQSRSTAREGLMMTHQRTQVSFKKVPAILCRHHHF